MLECTVTCFKCNANGDAVYKDGWKHWRTQLELLTIIKLIEGPEPMLKEHVRMEDDVCIWCVQCSPFIILPFLLGTIVLCITDNCILYCRSILSMLHTVDCCIFIPSLSIHPVLLFTLIHWSFRTRCVDAAPIPPSFHVPSTQANISGFHFYTMLECRTDNTSMNPPPVSMPFIHVVYLVDVLLRVITLLSCRWCVSGGILSLWNMQDKDTILTAYLWHLQVAALYFARHARNPAKTFPKIMSKHLLNVHKCWLLNHFAFTLMYYIADDCTDCSSASMSTFSSRERRFHSINLTLVSIMDVPSLSRRRHTKITSRCLMRLSRKSQALAMIMMQSNSQISRALKTLLWVVWGWLSARDMIWSVCAPLVICRRENGMHFCNHHILFCWWHLNRYVKIDYLFISSMDQNAPVVMVASYDIAC